VTEPDPIAALAAQLDELRGQLARYTGETGHLRVRMNEDAGQVVMLRLEIKQLGEKIEAAIARRDAGEPQAPSLLGLSKEEYRAWLAKLRAWVDRVGLGQYPGYFERLPACWPNHLEAVTELSNVMTEWTRIFGDPDNRDLAAALIWHDRWLPGVLSRLAGVIKCDPTGCQRIRKQERAPPSYT
jgi:hypothetical protein